MPDAGILLVAHLLHLLLVDLIADAGGKWIFIGMESIDPQNMADVNKTFSKPANYKAVLDGLARRNIYAITSFIFGMDNDTPGVADRTGSITPGKKADLVVIDTKAVNTAPVIDPVGTVVCAADISNVKTVLVDGRIVKQDFRLAAELGGPRRLVEESRDYLVSRFGEPEPGWLPTRVPA